MTTGGPPEGFNSALHASIQNAGASANAGMAEARAFCYLMPLEHGAGQRNYNLQNIAALNTQKQIMCGAGQVALLPTLNNQSLCARIIGEILSKCMSMEEFAGLLGEMSETNLLQEFRIEEASEVDTAMVRQTASMKVAENAASSTIDI